MLSGSLGHLGFSVGAAYPSATGTIQAVQTATIASKSQVIGPPLAGTEFRIFPVRGHRILEVDGGLRGMGFGSYGHYVQANANADIGFGPLTFQGGYRAVNADLHQSSNGGSDLSARLRGSIFSLLFRWQGDEAQRSYLSPSNQKHCCMSDECEKNMLYCRGTGIVQYDPGASSDNGQAADAGLPE